MYFDVCVLMSLEDRLRLKLKVKTEISLCMTRMLDHPWQSRVLPYCVIIQNYVMMYQGQGFSMAAALGGTEVWRACFPSARRLVQSLHVENRSF